MTLPTDTLSLLAWIAAGGFAGFLALILERVDWFQQMSAQGKVLLSFSICAVLAVLATILSQTLSPATIAAIDPSVKAVLALAPFFVNQLAHLADKKYSGL